MKADLTLILPPKIDARYAVAPSFFTLNFSLPFLNYRLIRLKYRLKFRENDLFYLGMIAFSCNEEDGGRGLETRQTVANKEKSSIGAKF